MESKEKVNPRGEKAKEKTRQQDLEESQQSIDLCCPRTSSKGVPNNPCIYYMLSK